MLKNSDGKKSISYTIAWIAFVYVLVIYAIGMLDEIHLKDRVIKFRQVDSSFLFFLLTPAFSLYGFRKYVDRKFSDSNNKEKEDDKK